MANRYKRNRQPRRVNEAAYPLNAVFNRSSLTMSRPFSQQNSAETNALNYSQASAIQPSAAPNDSQTPSTQTTGAPNVSTEQISVESDVPSGSQALPTTSTQTTSAPTAATEQISVESDVPCDSQAPSSTSTQTTSAPTVATAQISVESDVPSDSQSPSTQTANVSAAALPQSSPQFGKECVEFKNQKRGTNIFCEGYSYRKDKGIYYKCTHTKDGVACKARAKLVNGYFYADSIHKHPPNPMAPELARIRNMIKDQANANHTTPTKRLVNNILSVEKSGKLFYHYFGSNILGI